MNSNDHNRIVLLFDLDCFYAQCERVRLGLDIDVSLALLQWNSVLAVSYPARKFGIKRGDSWEDVAKKSNQTCWAIHLHVLEKEQEQQQEEEEEDLEADLPTAYNKIYKLSKEQQLLAQNERGKRRFHHEGKACLERYRLASMRIFSVVLESLTKRLGGKDEFILERASIDEFYLDITHYCYQQQPHQQQPQNNNNALFDGNHNTVVVGSDLYGSNGENESSSIQLALERACHVSQWIRTDVWDTLGFTMSAGISTNKMMAKLAASYGKPNGQGVLHPKYFSNIMLHTKLKKVRNFGGKLGKQVIQQVLNGNVDASMADLAQIPLPTLRQHLSPETAQFVFLASRGIDREAVKETTGALVKSITAFKSFTATANRVEIEKWLDLLVGEIITRVSKDTARNKRYPKSCTLNYTYYTTPSGQRPKDGTHRTQRNSRSLRLDYPNEHHPEKIKSIKKQAMDRLLPLLAQHPLRGVGLSACNFETRGQPGVASIDNFFSTKKNQESKKLQDIKPNQKKRPRGVGMYFSTQESTSLHKHKQQIVEACNHSEQENATTVMNSNTATKEGELQLQEVPSSSIADMDMELAKKLQASYDRENYILSTANRRKGGPMKKKPRGIDAFFGSK